MTSASAIRQKIKELRKSQTSESSLNTSHSIIQKIVSLPDLTHVNWKNLHVGLYRAIPGEIQLEELEIFLRQKGSRLFFPRVIRSPEAQGVQDRPFKDLEFVEVQEQIDPTLAWSIGPYGIQEPHPELKAFNPQKLDVVFVPGVAFGLHGERIGAGGGYYDRFFAQVAQTLRVALAFDFQLEEKLPQADHDQPVHWIFTEKREVRTPFLESWFKRVK